MALAAPPAADDAYLVHVVRETDAQSVPDPPSSDRVERRAVEVVTFVHAVQGRLAGQGRSDGRRRRGGVHAGWCRPGPRERRRRATIHVAAP
jgi:hypothetical protein